MKTFLKLILSFVLVLGLFSSCETEDPVLACEVNRTGDITLINEEYRAPAGVFALGPIDYFRVDWNNQLFTEGTIGSMIALPNKPVGKAEILAIWETIEGGLPYIYWVEGYFTVYQCENWEIYLTPTDVMLGRMAEPVENKNDNFVVTNTGRTLKSDISDYSELKTK